MGPNADVGPEGVAGGKYPRPQGPRLDSPTPAGPIDPASHSESHASRCTNVHELVTLPRSPRHDPDTEPLLLFTRLEVLLDKLEFRAPSIETLTADTRTTEQAPGGFCKCWPGGVHIAEPTIRPRPLDTRSSRTKRPTSLFK